MAIVQRRALERLGAGGHRGRTLAAVMTRSFGLHCRAMRAGMRGLAGMVVVAATCWRGVPGGLGGDVRRGVVRRAGRGRRQPRVAAGVRRLRPPNVRSEHPARLVRDRRPVPDAAAGQLVRPPDGTTAPFLHQRQLGLRRACRHAHHPPRDVAVRRQAPHERRRSRPGPDGDQGDPWRVFARDEGAQLIGGVFGENCTAPRRRDRLLVRRRHAAMSAASRAVVRHQRGEDRRTPSRARRSPDCPRAIQNTPIATIKVFGTRVTITDNIRPDARASAARSLAAGWRRAERPRRPTTRPTAPASAPVRLDIARPDAARRARRATTTAPRRARRRRALDLRVPDGHAGRDARRPRRRRRTPPATRRSSQRTISVDGTPPARRRSSAPAAARSCSR